MSPRSGVPWRANAAATSGFGRPSSTDSSTCPSKVSRRVLRHHEVVGFLQPASPKFGRQLLGALDGGFTVVGLVGPPAASEFAFGLPGERRYTQVTRSVKLQIAGAASGTGTVPCGLVWTAVDARGHGL